MQWIEPEADRRRITGLACRHEDGECTLTWNWPEGISFVYIYGFENGRELPPEERAERAAKLYTREEYKANTGYRDRPEGIGRYAYRVYPGVVTEGKPAGIRQQDEDNLVRFSAGRAKIRFSIKYGGRLFSRRKTARLQFRCEIPVDRDVLCYVKKAGSTPLHPEDGTVYPLIQNLDPGLTVFPEIEIDRNDHLKIFFTDGKRYGEIYDLIPE